MNMKIKIVGFVLILIVLSSFSGVISHGFNVDVEDGDFYLQGVEFVYKNLRVEDDEVVVGEEVDITVTVVNIGDQNGTVFVDFYIDGDYVAGEFREVPHGESVDLTISYTFDTTGVFDVHVEGIDGEVRDELIVEVDSGEVFDPAEDFRFYVQSVAGGEIRDIDRAVNFVNYSGMEMIFIVDFDDSVNVESVRFEKEDDVDHVRYWISDDMSVYHYKLSFESSREYRMYIQLFDAREIIVLFEIDDADVVIVDSSDYDMYREHYQINIRNLAEIEEIMGRQYDDDPEGVEGAYADVIADSRVLRRGPVRTGEHFLAAGMFMFLSPYMILIIIMIVGFVSVKYRTLSDKIRGLTSGQGDDAINEELLLVKRLERAKKRKKQARIEELSDHLNVSRLISSKISNDVETLGKMMRVISETKITENEFRGRLRDLLFKWIKNYVKVANRSADDIYDDGDRSFDPKKEFPDAIRRYVDYIVNDVGYHQYSDYLDHYDTVIEVIDEEVDKELEDEFKGVGSGGVPNVDTRDDFDDFKGGSSALR